LIDDDSQQLVQPRPREREGLASSRWCRRSDTHDRIIQNGLHIQLGDQALARDLHADLREQLVRSSERRYDMEV
jgi:hypothetical protein